MKRPKPSDASRERLDRVYGLSAALAVFAHRPESVASIAHTEAVRQPLAAMLRDAAKRRIAYREVSEDELSRMTDSIHHEGLCLLVRPLPSPSIDDLAQKLGEPSLLLALDGVSNPHNVGAMLRTAAYFGVAALVLADAERTLLTPAARRVAEGGAELVPVVHVTALAPALRRLADRGFSVFGADAHAKLRLDELRWPKRSVLVLGHEQHGLSSEVKKTCKQLLLIGGGQAIDSLNVSVAAGIFMASFASATRS